jgi:hypothetical protein
LIFEDFWWKDQGIWIYDGRDMIYQRFNRKGIWNILWKLFLEIRMMKRGWKELG